MKMKICAALLATLGAASSSPVVAGEVDELKAMVKQLQQRLEQLETRETSKVSAAPASAANVVMAGDLPGSIKVPGTDTSLKIYGFAQLDVTHDFKGRSSDINNWDWASAIFVQPFDNRSTGKSSKGQTYATARTSRIGFQTATPTASGVLTTKVEGDFNAPNQFQGELLTNSTTFRMRHAYGELGNFLVGQTWSNFSDLGSFPDTVDFNPPGTTTLLRQPQIRYSMPIGSSKLALSVENSQSLSLPTKSGSADFDRTPDLVANWTIAGDRGHLSMRAVSLEYRNDDHSKRGYGLGLSGSVKFGNDTLVAGVQGGEGIGRYMLNSAVQGGIDNGNEIRLWKAAGWHLGYTHAWNTKFRSNLIVSQTTFGKDDSANKAQRALGSEDLYPNRKVDQAYVNTFWAVEKNMELGLEYAWGKRTTFNDEVGTQNRVNATVHYNFF